jgi:hypothetical protein
MKKVSRLDITIYIIFGTVGLLIPLVVTARHFFDIDLLPSFNWGRTVLGIIFTLLATAVCLLNVMLSTIGPWLYKRKHGSMKDFGSMSGLPMVGSFFVLFAGALMPPSVLVGSFLLILYVIDGNGFPSFFFEFIRDTA